MKIYINNQLVKSEILPNNTPTQDETLETFSFALISNKNPMPYAPMQKIKVDFKGDGTDVAYFLLISDSVETYSLNPLRYKHSIVAIQNTRELSKHVVRNSVFTQPGYLAKSAFNAESASPHSDGIDEGEPVVWDGIDQPSLNWASEKLTLIKREKIKSARFNISFQWYREEGGASAQRKTLYSDAHTVADIIAHANCYDSFVFNDTFTLYYEDENNNSYTETINAATFGVQKIDLNSSYEFPRIVELAKQGFNNFEIRFNSYDLFSAVYAQNPTSGLQVEYWQMQIEIVAEIYWWNCYEVLDLLNKRQQKESSYHISDALFSLPESGELYDLLNNTIAPNFTFTQLTMYECVADVFRLFDAIFTMDENGVLDIDYFNDLEPEPLTNETLKLTGRTLSIGEDKYTNGLITYYQDARTEEAYPKDGRFAPLRSAEFGVPSRSDHNFIVPHSIDSIIKCEVLLPKITYDEGRIVANGDIVVDITRFILDQNTWSMLNTGSVEASDYQNRTVKQANSLFYVKGDNKIQVAFSYKNEWNVDHYGLFNALEMALVRMSGYENGGWSPTDEYKTENWDLFRMRITYITSVNGEAKIHSLTNKYDGESLIDQSNGAVDLNKLGLNMLGLSMKLGNPTLNATHKITSWNNRIRKGQIYEWTVNGKTTLWVANVVNYTFFNGRIQGKISFVQNFNQLALRTQLLREKRMTNISKELVQRSEEILTDFVYFSSEPIAPEYTSSNTYFNRTQLMNFIRDSFNIIGPRSKVDDFFLYDESEVNWAGEVKGVYIPTVKYGAGNTINFEMAFDDPMNAGNQTKKRASSWAGTDKIVTYHVVYTEDSEGRMVIYGDENAANISYGFLDRVSIVAPVSTEDYTTDFPIVTLQLSSPVRQEYISIRNLEVYKQPNEIFALNYQLAFLPLPGRENTDFVGNEFINNNCFVKAITENKLARYIVFRNKKSSNLDIKATPYFLKKEITSVTLEENLGDFDLALNFNALTAAEKALDKFVSWNIIDERDNVLFASNKALDLQSTVNHINIYFIGRHKRVD